MAKRKRTEATLVDPASVRAGRVKAEEAGIDADDRIVVTWEAPLYEVAVVLTPAALGNFVTASLNALGFPEGDLRYIAERLERELI